MGNAASSGYMMTVNNVAQILGEDWDNFLELLEQEETTLDEVAYDSMGGNVIGNETIDQAIANIYSIFQDKTTVGNSFLSIELDYYDRDMGDRYDDMEEGGFFWVSGNKRNTEAGDAFKQYIDYANFVTFG